MLPKPFIYYPFYPLVQCWFRVISPPILPSLFFHLYLQLFLSFHLFPSIPSLHTMLLISIFSFRLPFFFPNSPIIHPTHLQSSIHPFPQPFHLSASVHSFTHFLSSTSSPFYHPSIHTSIHPPII